MPNKIVLDDIEVETLNFSLPLSVPTFIINDGFLLKKETLLSLPYRFLLISSKRRLDIYTPYYHEAIDSRFAPFGGLGKEYADLLVHDRRLDIYTPYYHDAIDSRFAPFGGLGKEYADLLVHDIIDKYLKGVDFGNVYYGGISLGGLHTIYASTLKEIPFNHFFSICGSFWYPGFVDYVKENVPENKSFYLLNGKKEGLNHPNTPLRFAFSSASEIAEILKQKNEAIFVSDEYSHHDHLTERFLSLVESMSL